MKQRGFSISSKVRSRLLLCCGVVFFTFLLFHWDTARAVDLSKDKDGACLSFNLPPPPTSKWQPGVGSPFGEKRVTDDGTLDPCGRPSLKFYPTFSWGQVNGIDTLGGFIPMPVSKYSIAIVFKPTSTARNMVLLRYWKFAVADHEFKINPIYLYKYLLGFVPTGTYVSSESWHQLVYVYDNGSNKFYLDGQLIADKSMGIGSTTAYPVVTVGGKTEFSYDNPFSGYISVIYYWRDLALSNLQVAALNSFCVNY